MNQTDPQNKDRSLMQAAASRMLLLSARVSLRKDALLSRSHQLLGQISERLKPGTAAVSARIAGIRTSRIQSAALIFSLAFVIPMASALRPSIRVTYNNMPIGAAADASVITEAVHGIENSVSSVIGEKYVLDGNFDYSYGLSTVTSLKSAEETADAIIDGSDELDKLSVLRIDGSTIAACETPDSIQRALDSVADSYSNGSTTASSRFLNDVNVSTVPAPVTLLTDAEHLSHRLTDEALLAVEVTDTVNYTEAIPFDTIEVDAPDLAQNKTRTIQEGADGTAAVTAEVITVNGKEQTRTIKARTVLSEATSAVVQVGSKNIGIGTGTLKAPLTSYRFSSGFKFRNGRWHKGVDLCTPVGSPVYAADNARVIVSEWSDSFGNYIVLDHQNGMKTLYAHNSELIAKVGDVVEQGQQIALSGNTGRSSGPHVHFEVHVDGTAVNPELYINF